MCMKNVNITIIPCKEVSDDGNSLLGMFDSIVANKNSDNELFLEKLSLFLNMSIVLPKIEGDAIHDNEIEKDTEFEVAVRLTYLQNQTGITLASFPLSLESKEIVDACRSYWEFHRIITANGLKLQGDGKYALKVLIRKKDEDKWTTQALHSFTVA